ncbi:MAG: metallophosphoesterase [Thermoprotei archaeon]|nr:MAG: metallophosphoesterase [Thermoprotei archaeon]
MSGIKVAATADIHSPKNLDLLKSSSQVLKEADLLILAGDIIYRGRVEGLNEVLGVIKEHYSGPIFACFGNEEFDEVKPKLMSLSGGLIKWLDDEATIVEIKGYKIGLIGTRGCLDQPTSWQLKNIPNIRAIYNERLSKIGRLIQGLKCDYTILFSHYALCKETLEGEDPKIWPQLGCSKMGELIKDSSVTVAVHGHVHKGRVLRVNIGSTLVLNVSLPAAKTIVTFTLPPQPLEVKGQLSLTTFF